MELGALYQTIGRGLLLVRTAGAGFTQTARGLSTAATRTGAGVYVMTLATATPAASSIVTGTIKGLAEGNISVSDTSDTVKTISTFNAAGAAADLDFDVLIEQVV